MALVTYSFTSDESNDFKSFKQPGRGPIRITISGNFGGGTLSIAGSVDGTTYATFPDGAYTSATSLNIEWQGDIRFTLAGSTSPDLKVSIDG
jgi:hypothetical protein